MTLFQLLMLGASAFFAYKIYEHIQTLKDEDTKGTQASSDDSSRETRTAEAFSTFDSSSLMDKADEEVRTNNLDKALAIYNEANIKEPKNGETLFKMAYVLAQQERYEEALEYYEEALQADSENPFTYYEMALVLIKEQKIEKAKECLEKALELEPELTQAKEELEKLAKAV